MANQSQDALIAEQKAKLEAMQAKILELEEKQAAPVAISADFDPVIIKHGDTIFEFPYPLITIDEKGKMVEYKVSELNVKTAVLDALKEKGAFLKA